MIRVHIFGRKKKDEALLTQLSRIADSLEQSNQPPADDTNQAMVTQLNRIAEVIAQGNLSEIDSKDQAVVLQLGKIVDTLERNYQEMPGETKKAQLIQLERIANALEQSLPRKTEMSAAARQKAVYALNLCMVSISQIIDYSDLYVLEQEYEGILNNLNLENMPKDEALLDILRQILDTITFFRIQEGEKKFIEQEYQSRMKTAIWSAVPNCGVILACAEPKAMLLSLVTQIGTGYMNYRRTKAEAGFAREKAEWELQKAAIEQFNGLRRELFTTAWRLAKEYGFEDELRLTESQIAQYNRVLMDTNPYRRFKRLEDLEKYFGAYPPFWYFKGHTALEIGDTDSADEAYEKYFNINTRQNRLLRTDPIYATCALEWVSLMGENEQERKLEYIGYAIDSAGSHFDILQLCAMAYLDMREVDKATDLLRRLVCEGYNDSLNAQLLSSLYINKYLEEPNNETPKKNYDNLCKYTEEDRLITWPDTDNASVQELYNEFIRNHRAALLDGYANFLCHYYDQKSAQLQLLLADAADREKVLVKFIHNLESELASFPSASVEHGDFIKKLSNKKPKLEDLRRSGYTSQKYEEVFGDIFLSSASNIAARELSNMEQITTFELELGKSIALYMSETKTENTDEPEYTINALLEEKKYTSERFEKIKGQIRSEGGKLLKSGAKKTELLISGEKKFEEYIHRHRLEKTSVVAVINDSSANDCDLIFTENGLLVHVGESTVAKVVKVAAFGIAGGLVGIGASLFADYALRLFSKVTLYTEVDCNGAKLIKPVYKNKNIDMQNLAKLIESLKVDSPESIESKIHQTINKGKKNAIQNSTDDIGKAIPKDTLQAQLNTMETETWDSLPKKDNCNECGCEGCREFARNVAYGIKEIDDCPYHSTKKLKGLDLFKLSPKKNCKECGSPTCMHFCMEVARGNVTIDKCPYFDYEVKLRLKK